MRVLIGLSLVQTGLLLVLVWSQVVSDDAAGTALPAAQQPVTSPFAAQPSADPAKPDSGLAHADQLRAIIREELRAYGGSPSRGDTPTAPAEPPSAEQMAEYQRQREHVARRIEYFTSVGTISEQEMAQLQSEIARLDQAGRQDMLRELVRVLNSGQLDGRL